jgi:prefoldin beta subunit
MNDKTKEKITQLQNIEQNINTIIGQKQQFQAQSMEIDNALSQVNETDKVFRIIGNVMVASTQKKATEELKEKKEIVELRLKTMEKQEEKMREQAAVLQKDVLKDMD